MELITIIAIALGLSFDSFAVSLSCGVNGSEIKFRGAARIATVFALFQGGFTLTGFFLGSTISYHIERYDHWIAFLLLMILGIRMIIGGIRGDGCRQRSDFNSWPVVLALAIGTSIDALAVGISLALLHEQIWVAGAVIAAVTFIASMLAIRIGRSAGRRLGQRVEIAGGIILALIGTKILVEHLTGMA